MYETFSDYINDAKTSGKDWLKSQLKISAITFVLLLIGLFIADIILENKMGTRGIALDIVIPFVALGLAFFDALPVIGLSVTMLPWAFLAAIIRGPEYGAGILIVFATVMLIKTFLEPYIRGKSLGVSTIEVVIAAIIGWFILPKGIGLVVAPLIYTIGKKFYVKSNPNTFFANFGYNFLGKEGEGGKKADKKPEAIDITDDVEDVK